MSSDMAPNSNAPWYHGITRYQWFVLIIASLGWIFDVFEGQLFVACEQIAMRDLVQTDRGYYTKLIFASFLVGGALGGVLFGILSDRIGRKRAMMYTILMYSLFTSLSAFSQTWWHLAIFRFLVAMGVGGEWAVASALVAEVFPKRSRAWSQSIFHASSTLGTYLAVAVRLVLLANADWSITLNLFGTTWHLMSWRLAFLMGAIPALLIIWVRMGLRESDRWLQSQEEQRGQPIQPSKLLTLFRHRHVRATLVGVGLATVGMATFWGTFVFGKNVYRNLRTQEVLSALPDDATKAEKAETLEENEKTITKAEMYGMLLVTTGGGLGLVMFGPFSERLGRRGAFLMFHLGGLAISLIVFQYTFTEGMLYLVLPIFGFLTLGIHAGYAVYFPELFPTALRSTGGGFCFNVGRLLAAPILILVAWLQKEQHYTVEQAATLLSWLFLVGVVLLLAAPETRGQELPE